jgi:NADPH:quinone reductase-like Zn-dependent oxidoreductase
VIIYTKEDVMARVKEITSGKGVNVAYDSVGKDTYKVITVLFLPITVTRVLISSTTCYEALVLRF